MKACLFLVLFMLTESGLAQLSEPLFFKEKTHDFGELTEAGGTAEFAFTFINNSDRPVKIITVQASCGCTTPGWSTEPIEVGKTGFVKALFDPKNRPGYFNKTLTVTTDLDQNPIVLQIKGTVVDKVSAKDTALPVANGNIRLSANSFNLGKVYLNKSASFKDFEVMNAGIDKIDFVSVTAPAYIKVETPPSLKQNERGVIKIHYDAKLRSQYGFLSDRIEIHTTDRIDPVKSFSVYATAEEFFAVFTAVELAKAPALLASTYTVDFARVKRGTKVEQSIALQNKGKQSLEIRHIQSNCSCLTALPAKKTIKPGESASLQWSFNTDSRTGTQNKAITIYTNDPQNPVQRITISGYIEN